MRKVCPKVNIWRQSQKTMEFIFFILSGLTKSIEHMETEKTRVAPFFASFGLRDILLILSKDKLLLFWILGAVRVI